jgi:hypothetical protein
MGEMARRRFLAASGALGGATMIGAAMSGCTPPSAPDPGPTCSPPDLGAAGPLATPGSPGLLDEVAFRSRCDDYLRFATESLQPGDPTSVVAHLVRAEQDAGFTWDPTPVTEAAMASVFFRLDQWKDVRDFDLMYLHWMVRMGDGVLAPELLEAVRDRMVTNRWAWDDPLPADRLDHLWFWSENHRLITAVDEYLAGELLPDTVFTVTGLTGAQHRARARPKIEEWITERARHGFSEWHSHVYMLKNITPLLTLIELTVDDEPLVGRAATALDLCFYDIAARTHRGAYGAPRGRTYKKDKMSSLDEDTFTTAKLLFDDTDRDWQSRSDGGATYLAAAARYRCPEAIVRIARCDDVVVVRECHGFPLDPHEPIGLTPPVAPEGYDYDNPADLPFWWSQGALTAWQVAPMTLREANRYRLWQTDLFSQYDALAAFAGVEPNVARIAARELAPMAAFGVLGEAHTYTWRSPEVSLSSVVDHRFGDKRDQAHAWQATVDPDALVFTTHPSAPTPQSLEWRDDTGYWTGSASMPRSAQHRSAAIHIYRPSYLPPQDRLLGRVFGYLPETHAYFPVERFDEWVEVDGWVAATKDGGHVALWSWRPASWRIHDPSKVATRGMTRFDWVAPGGPDNVWVVECGRAVEVSFEDFVDGVRLAPPEVTQPGPGHLDVRYRSPSAGELRFGSLGPFTVDGTVEPLRFERLESPWGDVCRRGEFLDLTEDGHRLAVDFTSGARVVS